MRTGTTNSTSIIPVTETILQVNGMNIRKQVCGNIVSYSTQNATPTATGDFTLDTSVSLPYGLVLIMDGLRQVIGYIFTQSGYPVMRISTATTSLGFVATYITV